MSAVQVRAEAVRLASLCGSEAAAPAPDHGVEGGGGVDARLPTSSRVLTSSALAASLVLSTARQGGRDTLWKVRKLRPLALCPQPAGRREVLPDSWWPVGRPGPSLTPESQWVTEGGVGIGIF